MIALFLSGGEMIGSWIRHRTGLAWHVFAGCALAIGLAGTLALVSGQP